MWKAMHAMTRCVALLLVLHQFLGGINMGVARAADVFGYPSSYTTVQHAFAAPQNPTMQSLHGRFLHITDLHMDMYYENGTTIESACHKLPDITDINKPLAEYWGAPMTNCDTPPALIRHTIAWLGHVWADQVDFVIWTGDNARHDLDKALPRTKKEILKLNHVVTTQLKRAFTRGNRTVPIVPCLGNNDVHPHNLLRSTGKLPKLLDDYATMWRDLIPLDQQATFRKGGYFAVDVAPGIRVLSLNTLYFYNLNTETHDCDRPGKGVTHLQWLRSQLVDAQRRQMRVYVMGHVPPSVNTFYPACLSRYIDLSLEFANVIAGQMFGHVNMDHFILLKKQDSMEDSPVSVTSDDDFITSVYKQYKAAKDDGTMVVVNVAPPIIPLFYPTFRVNSYDSHPTSSTFGDWTKYTQYFTNLTYWNAYAHAQDDNKPTGPIFDMEYATDTTYGMSDLTAKSWIQLAQHMTANTRKGKALWDMYVSHMFVKTRDKENRDLH